MADGTDLLWIVWRGLSYLFREAREFAPFLLSWPAVFFWTILILRKPIVALIPQVKTIKVKDTSIEFKEIVEMTAKNAVSVIEDVEKSNREEEKAEWLREQLLKFEIERRKKKK